MPNDAGTATAQLKLELDGQKFAFTASVPKGDVTLRELLPILRDFTHGVVSLGVDKVAAQGKEVSCKAGCGACCSQMVPINRSEAFVLRDVVSQMPEPRRSEVMRRFADAKAKFAAAGMFDALMTGKIGAEGTTAFGMRYFQFGIPCPFLEDQSCSIYADRPLKCREYLVTSPAERCANPAAGGIEGVPVTGKPANAAMRVGSQENRQQWVALIAALDWAEANVPDQPSSGIKLFEDFLAKYTDK